MIYKLMIKGNISCPQAANVMQMVENKIAGNIKTVVGPQKLYGKYALYVDFVDKQNLYGSVFKITNEDNAEVTDIDLTSGTITLLDDTSKLGQKLFFATFTPAEGGMVENGDENNISEKLKAAIDKKVAEGFDENEIMERISVMQTNFVPESLAIRIVNSYRKYNKAPHKPSCVFVDPYLKKGVEGLITEGLRNADLRMASICEGEKSVGKNVYMETIAWLLGMPLYMIGFSRQMSPSAVYGEKSTDNSASEELQKMHDEAIAKVMLSSGMQIKDVNGAIKAAAKFEMAKARAASVSIVIDQSELYDWMIDGGVMVFNEMNMGATCC